ncbi:MAG TPA: HAMP domain-containing sensor histidine kinase [Anaeromyxobacteraceae bacterium]|nr:HAMP domain-containing sensor histidine kinase [Anaeromyxobacteraceae bacterium]
MDDTAPARQATHGTPGASPGVRPLDVAVDGAAPFQGQRVRPEGGGSAAVARARAVRASGWLAGVVAAGAAAVLAGWALDVPALKSIAPGYITMKANTAVAFLVQAAALLVLRRAPASAGARALGAALAAVAAAIGLLTLYEYLSGRTLPLDELLFADPEGRTGRFPPGRLAPITAVNFALLGVAITLSHARRTPAYRAAHVLVLLAFVAGFQGLVGYVLGSTYAYGVAFWSQMALHTTAFFVLLCAAAFLSRPDQGLMGIATSDTAGGKLARSLVASAVLVPPVVAWLALAGERLGLYDQNFTTLFRVVGNSVFFAGIVWRNAAALHRVDLARDEATAARLRSHEAMRAALRARDEFLTVASHELKTPLTTLRLQLGRFRALAGAAPPSPLAQAVLDGAVAAERQVARLAALSDEILEVSTLSAGSVQLAAEEVDVGPCLASAVEASGATLSAARCTVGLRVEDGLRVRADRRLLVEVLRRLLHNTATHAPGARVEVRARREGEAVVVEVADEGPGIAPADQERIFERFERAVADADKTPGFGVGLYVARQIVRAHGGELWVESAPGRGATFSFALPARPPPPV